MALSTVHIGQGLLDWIPLHRKIRYAQQFVTESSWVRIIK